MKPESISEQMMFNTVRLEADHRVHRERNYDGAVFSYSDVDVRKEDRKQLEEDTVV